MFFKRQTPESLQKALIKASKIPWDHAQIRDHALNNFTEQVFFGKVEGIIEEFQRVYSPKKSMQFCPSLAV